MHLVDLNGAFAGEPQNFPAIADILAAVSAHIPVQLGGGIRDLATIEKYLNLGLTDVIIGTAAVKNPNLCAKPAANSQDTLSSGWMPKTAGLLLMAGQP